MRPLLRRLQWFLAVSAVLLFAYTGFILTDTWLFQRAEARQFQSVLTAPRPGVSPVSLASLAPAGNGGLIGRLDIPRLSLSVMVMEGDSSKILRRAAGHITGTALPGQPGNIGISGHRDTFFLPLRNIAPNDIVTLTTIAGEYRYRVVSTRVVAPDDLAVLDPGVGETLTIVTCYPFYFVGPAPSRFIVRAARIV